jgi:hypothetical protein
MSIGAVATAAAISVWGGSLLLEAPVGRTLPPSGGAESSFTIDEADRRVEAFVNAIMDENRDGSWAMLTSRSQERIGGQQNWAQTVAELRSEIFWIEADATRLWTTRLPGRDRETFLATFTAPPQDGSALLEVFTLEEDSEELAIDLKRRYDISFTPEAPVFMACQTPCEPEEQWPTIRAGDTFSFLLERMQETFTTTIDDVWFTVGDNDWVGKARLIEGAKEVRAQVTFEPVHVNPGQNVLTITVETSDGSLETYGYRAIYEDD